MLGPKERQVSGWLLGRLDSVRNCAQRRNKKLDSEIPSIPPSLFANDGVKPGREGEERDKEWEKEPTTQLRPAYRVPLRQKQEDCHSSDCWFKGEPLLERATSITLERPGNLACTLGIIVKLGYGWESYPQHGTGLWFCQVGLFLIFPHQAGSCPPPQRAGKQLLLYTVWSQIEHSGFLSKYQSTYFMVLLGLSFLT